MQDEERHKELASFLRTRRNRITPAQVALPTGTRRRTLGLRREEVAQLAGVGVTWYTWLEQGRSIKVSEQVLESLARVLQLDADERKHLFMLAHRQIPTDPPPLQEVVSPTLLRTLDSLRTIPAVILGRRWDVLARNSAAAALFGELGNDIYDQNVIWLIFTQPSLRQLYVGWEDAAQDLLGRFRADSGRYPGDPYFNELISSLQKASEEFRQWWPRHEIQGSATICKELNHPVVGTMFIEPVTFQVSDSPNLKLIIYTPLPEAGTIEKLQRLVELESIASQSEKILAN